MLVPQGQWNFGTLDTVLGHFRRYTEASLTELARAAGFRVARLQHFNRLGSLPWFVNGRVFRRETVGLFQVRMLNLLTPLMRQADAFLPLPALSLIAVLEPDGEAPAASRRNPDKVWGVARDPLMRRLTIAAVLTALFGYEAYSLFVKRSGETAFQPRAAEIQPSPEIAGATTLDQTFVMHADGLDQIRLYARPSSEPPAGDAHLMLIGDPTPRRCRG